MVTCIIHHHGITQIIVLQMRVHTIVDLICKFHCLMNVVLMMHQMRIVAVENHIFSALIGKRPIMRYITDFFAKSNIMYEPHFYNYIGTLITP